VVSEKYKARVSTGYSDRINTRSHNSVSMSLGKPIKITLKTGQDI